MRADLVAGMDGVLGHTEQERDVQKQYWVEHSTNATVETMMLDSKAADIDKMERPEVRREAVDAPQLSDPNPPSPAAPLTPCLQYCLHSGVGSVGIRVWEACCGAGRWDR